MKMNLKMLLGALLILGGSNALFAKYSYMEGFTNNTGQPILMQNLDAGTERWVRDYENLCAEGGNTKDLRVDCLPFVIPAGKTYKFNNMVIPWRKPHGDVVANNLIFITAFIQINTLSGAPVFQKKIWTLQEDAGRIVAYESIDNGSTWQAIGGGNQDTGQFSFSVDQNGRFNISRW